jgi:chitin deacetylase
MATRSDFREDPSQHPMPHRPALALTFDDGPGPSTVPLLEVLEHYRVRATFFVLGRNLLGESFAGDAAHARDIAARVVRSGHLLGNHTMTHATELPPTQLLDEIAACDSLIREAYAVAGCVAPHSILVRLPFGPFRPDARRSMATLEGLGRPHCHWTFDTNDWRQDRTAEQIASGILRHAETAWASTRTPVLLLHDAHQGEGDGKRGGERREATVNAVAAVCARLRARAVRYVHMLECDRPPMHTSRPTDRSRR